MIGNFAIVQNASIPWLEVNLTKNGILPMQFQAPSFGCSDKTLDPNWVDLTDAENVIFEMYKCGRTPLKIGLSGQAEIVDLGGDLGKKTGLVRYKWHPNDTSVQGCYYGRFVVTFKDGTIFKWPYALESMTIEVK